ncbi:MAG: SDR family NAD(P)-dependent oxidoreductase [Melioribacteraceae bacterium]|nr:SDR family NAD(P)-dependent oxidoreductase [Melioribacteraceae bacterium]
MDFKGKTILITGASSGIGNALAKILIDEECNLILTARRIELMEKDFGHLNRERILILKCDVSKKGDVRYAYLESINKFGKIDIAILNAGYGQPVTVNNYNSDFAENTFGANVFGLIHWVEQLLPAFIKNRNGIIAGISSLADNRGFSGSGFYCASKAAATIYLEGLRVELKPYNIKVITIKPGFVKTPMTDKNEFKMPLLMSAEQAALIIIEGIKKEKRIIQFPWPTVWLTRFVGLLPGSVYEFLAVRFGKK